MATKKKSEEPKASSAQRVVAKSEDGTIQITFTIPYKLISKSQEEVLSELVKTIQVPGFRLGHAPLAKVKENVSENTLLEKTLSKILPDLVAKAITEEGLKPAIYPKFELVKAKEGEDWQIRAVTCEIPDIDLGDYKKTVISQTSTKKIWVPGKDKGKTEISRQEKEQEVMKALLSEVNIKISKVLIEEEVNTRLSNLLERLEKLGLTLESYLSSVNKTAQELRTDYEKQAKDALALDLILNKIAEKENIQVAKEEIDSAINAAKVDEKLAKELDTPERRRFIEVILKRRKALDSLIALI